MRKFRVKTIEFKGKNPEPDLYEINLLGLSGWKLDEVVQNTRLEVTTYTYIKLKWWAFIFEFDVEYKH